MPLILHCRCWHKGPYCCSQQLWFPGDCLCVDRPAYDAMLQHLSQSNDVCGQCLQGPKLQLRWLFRYLLVTPLVSEQWGTAALVMRGWVPDTWRNDPAAREPYQPAGQVSLRCIMAVLTEVFPCAQLNGMPGVASIACCVHPDLQAIWEAVFDTGVDNDVSDTAFLACSVLYFVNSPCVRRASMALCLSACTSGNLPSRHTQQLGSATCKLSPFF